MLSLTYACTDSGTGSKSGEWVDKSGINKYREHFFFFFDICHTFSYCPENVDSQFYPYKVYWTSKEAVHILIKGIFFKSPCSQL